MTAMDTTAQSTAGDIVVRRVDRGATGQGVGTARGIPATRDLERTLWHVLAAAGIATAAAVATRHPAALAGAALLMAVAIAILRTVTTLPPPALRRCWTVKRQPLRVAVVGSATSTLELVEDLNRAGVDAVEVVGAIAPGSGTPTDMVIGGLAEIRRLVASYRLDLLLVGPNGARGDVIEAVMRSCEGQSVRVCDMPAFYEDVYGHVPLADVDETWMQYVLHPRFRERRSQRVIDVIVAGALAVVVLPLMAGLALLIRRDGGPTLFRQERIGRDGRRFEIYKLRSMRWQPAAGAARWAEDGDPRITPIGRFLRRTHLDELPQLINVLRGDMTLVGPRPEQPAIVERLKDELPLWRGRHRYRPGLTGWAQVRCGYAGSHDGSARKLAHDLYYLRHQSLALDAAILANTASMLLFARRDADGAATGRAGRPAAAQPPGAPRERPGVARVVPIRSGAPRALVTGGAGFIGSQLVDRLLDDGYDVVTIDDLSTGRWENLGQALARGARLEAADVTSADEMRRLFMTLRPQLVFHLAAQIEVSRAVEEPLLDAKANVVGTLSVLDAARACGADRFVLASSGGAVYGDAAVIPTPEDAPVSPLSPYGTAKFAAEQYAALYNALYGLSTVSMRLANVYGPRQGLSGEGGVIARFCRARVDGVPAHVFGDGLQTRDYVHVRDVVSAFVAAGRTTATGSFNIGTGTETTLVALLGALGLEAVYHAARSGDVRHSSLDATAALRQLGWRALIPLEEGLTETLAFARDAREASQIAV